MPFNLNDSLLKKKHPTNERELRPSQRVRATEIFCDFDGTITSVDGTDAVLEAFARPAWREWEDRWVRGEISSQECLARQVALIQVDRDRLVSFAAGLPVDTGIVTLARRCAEYDIPLTIVSDGIDLLIEEVLRRHGLLHLPVFSNHLRWDETGMPSLNFPFAAQECESRAGTCKCAIALSPGRRSTARTVYIGDGRSDHCVSAKVHTVFAKGALQGWCARQNIAYEPFQTLTQVAEHLFPKETHSI
ncbi:MAG: MtnX-like HAD-IB family phosphatase [Nitrospirales bacterium]